MWCAASVSRRRSTVAGRLGVAQGREGRGRRLESPDGRERGVDVPSVEDRRVDVVEAHVVKAGALQDAGGGVGIAERERVQVRRRWLGRVAQSGGDLLHPFVVLEGCQTSSTRRAPGRRASAMLANAAGGSEKNIVPKRLIATSKPARSNRCTWASPSSKRTLSSRSAVASWRARAIMPSDMSTPTTRPGAAARAASRVVSPAPQPMSRTASPRADGTGGAKVLVVRAQLGIVEVQAGRRGHARDARARRSRGNRSRPSFFRSEGK